MTILEASVIIPNLNSPLIDVVLKALQMQTILPREILVVGRDDARLVHENKVVQMITTAKPVSPAVARNIGAQSAQGDVLCYTDADCIARPDWIARLLKRHNNGAKVVGGGVAVEYDNYWQLCDNVVAFTPFLETSKPGVRPYLPSLNFSIRRTLMQHIGGFDERFPLAAGEDTDLSFRLRRAGYTLWFEPQAAVFHRHPRFSPGQLWRHMALFGRTYMEIYPQYPDLLGSWRRINLSSGIPKVLRIIGPALAMCDLVERMIRYPQLRAYVTCSPGLMLGMLAWYDGAAEGLRRRRY